MADKPTAGSLLSRLRQQSDAVRANESPRRSMEEILQDMDQRLWRAYRWLDEALAHLGVIKPVVAHEFRIDSYLTLSGLQFEQGFVSYRRRHLAGQDSLYSIVQMPKGIPVATFAIGEAGAANAALFAVSLLANTDASLAQKLAEYRQGLREQVAAMQLPDVL